MKLKYIVLDIETTGLNPCDNTITCICTRDSDGYEYGGFVGKNFSEAGLIEDILKNMCDKNPDFIVTKNGKQFDVPFIITRLPTMGTWLRDIKHIDLQEITKGRVKLDDMATLMGLENKSGEAKDAINLFFNKKYRELMNYCKQDVRVTEQVYLKWLNTQKRQGILSYKAQEAKE